MRRSHYTDTIGTPAGLVVPRPRGLGRGLGAALQSLAEVVMLWHERSRQRRQLARLSDHMLRDIGLSRAELWAECEKPFWRP